MKPIVRVLRRLRQVIQAIRYGFVLGIIHLLLPLTAIEAAPLHDLLGGLFLDLSGWDTFFLGMGVCATSLSLLWVEGIVMEDWRGVWNSRSNAEAIDREVRHWLNHQASRSQLAWYAGLGVPALIMSVLNAGSPVWTFLGFVTGWGVAMLLLLVAMAPAVVAAYHAQPASRRLRPIYGVRCLASLARYVASKNRVANVCKAMLGRFKVFACLVSPRSGPRLDALGYEQVSIAAAVPPAQPANGLNTSPLGGYWTRPRHWPEVHFFAVCLAGVLWLCAFVAATVFRPGSEWLTGAPSAVTYVYVFLAAGVWVFGFLELHLRRRGWSPLLVLLSVMLLGYTLLERDHVFEGRLVAMPAMSTSTGAVAAETPVVPGAVPLLPASIAVSPGSESNLIVVATSGGGILAAGWTTAWADALVASRPASLREIKVISGVSGGSVGAACLVEAMRRTPNGRPVDVTRTAFEWSTESSLAPVAYGLVFRDIPRFVTGGLFSRLTDGDRGQELEAAWRRTAGSSFSPSLFDLNGEVIQGRVPVLVMNATAVETGHRVLLTGMTFPKSRKEFARGPVLGEYLFPPSTPMAGTQVDLDLWTAARVSASFPYVTPAASLKATNRAAPESAQPQARHHFVDGGYHENFGVASALDVLQGILSSMDLGTEANRASPGSAAMRRIAFVELRAFRGGAEGRRPLGGAAAALIGPIETMLNIRGVAAHERNRIAVDRFLSEWKSRLASKVEIRRFEFERDSPDGPLSWHLTRAQQRELSAAYKSPELSAEMSRLRAFLDGLPEPENRR